MANVAFDTLRFATVLRDKAQMSQEQAEGLAFAMSDALQASLVTKDDLKSETMFLSLGLNNHIEESRSELKRDIEASRSDLQRQIEVLRVDLQRQIEASRSDILKWMFGAIGFQTLVLLGGTIALLRVAHP